MKKIKVFKQFKNGCWWNVETSTYCTLQDIHQASKEGPIFVVCNKTKLNITERILKYAEVFQNEAISNIKQIPAFVEVN